MSHWQSIEMAITDATGEPFKVADQFGVGGGCINTATRISDGRRDYFVKTNRAKFNDMFVAEAAGLEAMSASETIRVPKPACHGVADGSCFLVMEYLPMNGSANMEQLGFDLAAMHEVTQDQYGWSIDNTIGSTPQPNQPYDDWVAFWRDQRLGFQLDLADRQGYRGELQDLGERLLAGFHVLFESYTPAASMLHGDLWGGNYGGLSDGTPVIFDPAFYYGDREADIAMTQLFGGFNARFLDAYNDRWALDAGFSVRRDFYNLYHIINHLNLFGGSYQSQAINLMSRLLAEI